MEAVWTELIKALPWGFVIIALRYLDIKEKADERKERDANAKEKSEKDRETQVIIGKAYSDAISNLAKAIGDMKETIADQYRRIGVTKDLKEAATRQIKREIKGE